MYYRLIRTWCVIWAQFGPGFAGTINDNVGLHQDKYLLWHLGITCHERHVWHMTPCEPSQHKYRSRTWQSRTSEVTWDDKCLSRLSLSTSDRETESSIRDEDNGDDWWRSDQDLDNIDTIIVFSKFTTQIKCDGDEDLLRWVTVWQRSPESLTDTFFDLAMTIIVPHLPSSLGGQSCDPVFWLAASLQIIQSDVRIWQVSLLGGNVREGDGWAQNVPSASSLQCAAKPTVRHQSSSRAKKVLDSLSVLEL